jgi:hypothetical protein
MAAQPTSTIEPSCCLIPCQLSLCQAAVCTALAWAVQVQLCKNRTVPYHAHAMRPSWWRQGAPSRSVSGPKRRTSISGSVVARRQAPKPAGRSPVVAWLPSLSPATGHGVPPGGRAGPRLPVVVHEQRAASQLDMHGRPSSATWTCRRADEFLVRIDEKETRVVITGKNRPCSVAM